MSVTLDNCGTADSLRKAKLRQMVVLKQLSRLSPGSGDNISKKVTGTEDKEDSEVGEEDGILECVSHGVTGCEKIVEDEYVNSKEEEYDGNKTDSVSCDPSTPLTSVELVEMADMM